MTKKIIFTLTLIILTAIQANAQQGVDMADAFRANGKIYVVVGILSIVFTGITLFLIRLERKISKLEKEKHQS